MRIIRAKLPSKSTNARLSPGQAATPSPPSKNPVPRYNFWEIFTGKPKSKNNHTTEGNSDMWATRGSDRTYRNGLCLGMNIVQDYSPSLFKCVNND